MYKHPVYIIQHWLPAFAERSGIAMLAASLEAHLLVYRRKYVTLRSHSWRVGEAVRQWGNRYYGSEWNGLLPVWDEWRLARRIEEKSGAIVHFLWGEMASPARPASFRKRGNTLVGTFHATARSQPRVLAGYTAHRHFARISVMSKSQIPFFVDRGVDPSRIDVTLHGVDVEHYRPAESRPAPRDGDPLRLLLVGITERDHAFAAEVMRALAGQPVVLRTLTDPHYRSFYNGLNNVVFLPRVSDAELVAEYQQADLLLMPMLDCTANNSVLESMACGTPVMINRVGGVSEYVDEQSNFVMEGKALDDWTTRIRALAADRPSLHARRDSVRAWAERYAWERVLPGYLDFYTRAQATT